MEQPYLAACTIYRDAASYLAEWIEFHRLVGVERFFLYDNGSADDHREVLAPYVDEGIAVVHDWPLPFIGRRGRGRALPRAFEHCLGAHRDGLPLDRVPRPRRVPVLPDRRPRSPCCYATTRSTRRFA